MKWWQRTKDVFAIIGLAFLVAGLTALVFVIGRRKKDGTISVVDLAVDPGPVSDRVVAVLDAAHRRLHDLFQRVRVDRLRD